MPLLTNCFLTFISLNINNEKTTQVIRFPVIQSYGIVKQSLPVVSKHCMTMKKKNVELQIHICFHILAFSHTFFLLSAHVEIQDPPLHNFRFGDSLSKANSIMSDCKTSMQSFLTSLRSHSCCLLFLLFPSFPQLGQWGFSVGPYKPRSLENNCKKQEGACLCYPTRISKTCSVWWPVRA